MEAWSGDACDLFGQCQHLDDPGLGTRDNVVLTRFAFLHGEDVSTGDIVNIRPAVCRLFRNHGQFALQVLHEGLVDRTGVARSKDQTGHDNN